MTEDRWYLTRTFRAVPFWLPRGDGAPPECRALRFPHVGGGVAHEHDVVAAAEERPSQVRPPKRGSDVSRKRRTSFGRLQRTIPPGRRVDKRGVNARAGRATSAVTRARRQHARGAGRDRPAQPEESKAGLITSADVRKLIIGAGLGLAAALLATALGALPFVDVVELKTYDWRMRATADPDARARRHRPRHDRRGKPARPRAAGRPLAVAAPRARAAAELPGASAAARRALRRAVHRAATGGSSSSQDEEWTGADSDAELASAARSAARHLSRRRGTGGARGRRATAAAAGRTAASRGAAATSDAEPRPVFVPPIAAIAAVGARRRPQLRGARRRWPVAAVRAVHPLSGPASIPSLAVAAAACRDGQPIPLHTPADAAHADSDSRPPQPTARRRTVSVSFYKLFYAEQQLLAGQTPRRARRIASAARSSSSARPPRRSTMCSRCRWRGRWADSRCTPTVVDSILVAAHADASFARRRAVALTIGVGVHCSASSARSSAHGSRSRVALRAVGGRHRLCDVAVRRRASGIRSSCRCSH